MAGHVQCPLGHAGRGRRAGFRWLASPSLSDTPTNEKQPGQHLQLDRHRSTHAGRSAMPTCTHACQVWSCVRRGATDTAGFFTSAKYLSGSASASIATVSDLPLSGPALPRYALPVTPICLYLYKASLPTSRTASATHMRVRVAARKLKVNTHTPHMCITNRGALHSPCGTHITTNI